jgi:hypothetical protein
MEFKLQSDNTLNVLRNNQWIKVSLKPCFPVSKPKEYLSLRDEKNKEIVLIDSLASLDPDNKLVIEKYLEIVNDSFIIQGIYFIEEEYGTRHWEVKTQKGKRVFQTELENWPKKDRNGVIHISDLYGDKYSVKELEFGHKYLYAYID